MRPVNLKMSAFGPYPKSVELDFDKGLAGNNLFLIHGETGAGKTSILDAICYALYDKSSGGERAVKMLRATQATPRTPTTVEFNFALDNDIYTIRRALKSDNAERVAEIYCNGKIISAKPRDVDDRIKELIGFDSNQFCQVILLPQGNFKKFLTSNSGDRADVLNTIFDANFYAKVQDQLKSNAKTASDALDELTSQQKFFIGEIQSLGTASNDDLAAAKTKAAAFKAQLDDAVKILTDAKNLAAQFDTYAAAQKNLQELQAAVKLIADKFSVAQIEFDARKAEEFTRLDVAREIDSLNEISAALDELSRKKSELAAAEKSETSAKNNLNTSETKQKSYEARLAELKAQELELQGADADFVQAAQNLKDAKIYAAAVKEIARLRRELSNAQKNLDAANKNHAAAQKNLKTLQLQQLLGAASKLAESLEDGVPCPVCGAIHHPHPATAAAKIPTDDEISYAENILSRREIERTAATNAVTSIGEKIAAQQDILDKFDAPLNLDAAQKNFDAAQKRANDLKDRRDRLKRGEELTAEITAKVESARQILSEKTKIAENLRGIVAEKSEKIPPEYAANPQKIAVALDAAKTRKKNLDTAWDAAQANFHSLGNQKAELEGKFAAAKTAFNDAEKNIADKTQPDLDDLNNKKNLAQNQHTAAITECATIESALNRRREISKKLDDINAKIQAADKDFQIWKKLSDAANGANSKVTFQRYYLNSIFNEIIFEANEYFYRMSGGRYQFRGEKNALSRKKLEGLDLEILDAYNGTARAVETLSGGESFLAALSLALGLAAVVKNNAGGIKLDTIFIDEGFGSLDSETLDVAMNALMDLQEGGRLVGIISHVDALKSRVPVRLEVTKTKTGSTAHFVS